MSQHDLNIANQGFPAFRADLNDALLALGSTNSGATAPATTFANQLWYDTANNILKIRNEDNDAWISIVTLDQSGDVVSAITAATVNATTVNTAALNTTGNTVLGDASTDTLNVGNGGLVKDASGNVGVGTASPVASSLVTLKKTNAGGDGAELRLINSSTTVESATQIVFTNTTTDSGNSAAIKGVRTTSGQELRFLTEGTERFRLNATGAAVLQGGTVAANGVGIAFPASQSASSDANTLDDYEEGTWTPSVGGNATYTVGHGGRYVKVGNAVTVSFQIAINVIGTGSSATISGLPFATGNYGFVQSVSISYFASLTGNCYSLSMYINNNASTMNFVSTSSLTNSVNNGPALLGNNSVVYGSITYLTA